MSPDAAAFRVVLCTAGSESQARDIARSLVQRGLAACVNVVPSIASVYRWQGKVMEDDEALLIVKTSAARFEELRLAIRELHGYDVPEIVSLALSDGDADYLSWLDESL